MGAETDFKVIKYITEGSFNAGANAAKQTLLNVIEYEVTPEIQKVENMELNSNKARKRPAKVQETYNGRIRCYVKYGELDSFFAAVFRDSAWSTAVDITDTVYSMANVDNSINDSGSGFVVDAYVANQLLRTRGFTLDANNSVFKISSVAAAKMVLLGGTISDEIAGDSVTVEMGAQIVNGVTVPTFAFEEELSDLGSNFLETTGCAITSITLTVNNEEQIIAEINFIGSSQDNDTSTHGDGSPTAASTNEIMTFDRMDVITENNTSVTLSNNFSITFNAGIRPNTFAIGSVIPTEMNCGDFTVTGSIEYLLANRTIYNKIANATESSLMFFFEDSSNNGYGVEVVAIEYDAIRQSGGGKNTDMFMTADYNGHEDSSEEVVARMARFPA